MCVSSLLLTMAGLRKGIRDAQHRLLHLRRDMTTSPRDAYEVSDYYFARVESKLPFYDGKYDSVAYVHWELAVDNEFDKYDFSDTQKIKAASNKFTSSAFFWWSHVSNKPETWDECKTMMRKRFVSSYYKCILLEKLEHLKQGDRTVREYIYEFKVCIIYSGLKECNENTMRRFFNGLKSEIQVMLANVTYNHIAHLFMLARNIESQIISNATKHEQCDLSSVSEYPISLCTDDVQTLEEQSFVSPITNVLQGVQNFQQKKENDVLEKKEEKHEAPASSEECLEGKLNGAEINECEYSQTELHMSTFQAIVEQPLVEPIAEIPLSQDDLFSIPCDKEELCDNTSLISMPQLVNEHAIFSVSSLCADFKHVVQIANEVQERELLSSLSTLSYVLFDDFCELDSLKEKLFAIDLSCPTNTIFHIFGQYNNRGIYLVHKVYICSNLEPPVDVDKNCTLERHIIANHATSSFSSFDCKQVVSNGLSEEHHMDKPRTVFREEGEDDVTMATMDTTVAHIICQQEEVKIKLTKFCNPIRPPAALLSSNGRQICMRAPFWAHEYLMESSWSPLSNGSSLISKFHSSQPQSQKQCAMSPVMGLWACNFIWDPGPGGAHVGCAPTWWSTT